MRSDNQASRKVRLDSSAGRWVLAAAVLGSSVAMLTGTVVNVALPRLGDALGADTAQLQWVINAYLLMLASLILIGGSLGDRYGHRRIFVIGTALFAAASVLCALAPGIGWLIAFRALQGVGAALLVPESLAIIESVYHPDDRGRAIGAWSGLGGVAAAAGPLVGGWLVDAASWRWVFIMVLPLAATVIAVGLMRIPPTPRLKGERLDWPGALFAFLMLGLFTFGLIQGTAQGFSGTTAILALAGGAVCLAAFLLVESISSDPMTPLDMFANVQFAAGNAVTFAVYAALGGTFFLFVVYLQNGLGFSALSAGAAMLPITVLMLALSSRVGAFAQSRGPRGPLTVGPLLIAAGMLLMTAVRPGSGYWTSIFPAVSVLGLGLAFTVAPVTSLVLGAAEPSRSGTASGINNAVSRTAQLAAVAVLPGIAGLGGERMRDPTALAEGFPEAAVWMAALAAAGGALAWATVSAPLSGAVGKGRKKVPCRHCALDGAPLAANREA